MAIKLGTVLVPQVEHRGQKYKHMDIINYEHKLREACEKWRKVHNPFIGKEALNIMEELPAGITIHVDYIYTDSSHRRHNGKTTLEQVEKGAWHFLDTANTFDDEMQDTDRAHMFLDVAVCGSNSYKLWLTYKEPQTQTGNTKEQTVRKDIEDAFTSLTGGRYALILEFNGEGHVTNVIRVIRRDNTTWLLMLPTGNDLKDTDKAKKEVQNRLLKAENYEITLV